MRSEIRPLIVFCEAITARALPQNDFVKILPDQNGLTAGPLLSVMFVTKLAIIG